MKVFKKFLFIILLILFAVCSIKTDVQAAGPVTVYKRVNYAPVYDFNYYIANYPDLARVYSKNPKGALTHFVKNGMKEGRVASKDFDIEVYKNNNPDLVLVYADNNIDYYMHFISCGKNEGRIANVGAGSTVNSNNSTGSITNSGSAVSVYKGVDYSPVYDYDYYINTYEDVVATCGNDKQKVLEHFVNVGIPNRRKGNARFDVVIYMKYPDLRAAFGDNTREYYLHYISFGKDEDRIGNNVNVTYESVTIPGLSRDYEICFIADTHVALCDKRDEETLSKSYRRYENFMDLNGKYSDEVFTDLMATAKSINPDYLIMGGDIVDSAMYAAIEHVRNEVNATGLNYAYLLGNHDFEYGENYYNYYAYNVYLPRLDGLRTTYDGYQIIDMGEFTIFLADDDNYKFTNQAVDAFEREVLKGKPIIFMTHVPMEPLFDRELLYMSNRLWGKGALLGESKENLDQNTKRLLSLVLDKDSPVFAVFTGHLHFYHKDTLNGRISQVVTGPGYEGEMLRIRIGAN